jgi:putative Mg2+ transporter-C (MgtC) family protein
MDYEVFGQLALATLLGALIGIERELARKTAGMRTFALVALGAALFTIIPQIAFPKLAGTGFDPSRIASQVVVGIGFIGAGSIIFSQSRVKGITTAAGLWVSAAIGMAVAYKMYSLAIFVTFLTIFVLVFMWIIEQKVVKKLGGVAASSGDED